MSDPTTPSPGDRPGVLPCGRDPLDVVDHARAGTSDAHERECPYCRDAVRAADATGRATAELVSAETRTPVPDTLLPGVMRTVWSDLRRSTMIPLPLDTDAGSGFIADHAVGAVVEDAIDAITDLQLHTCRITLDPDPDATDGRPGRRVSVAVTAAAAYISDVRQIADRARDLVRRTVAEQFGWTVDAIDIDIVDLYVPEGPRS